MTAHIPFQMHLAFILIGFFISVVMAVIAMIYDAIITSANPFMWLLVSYATGFVAYAYFGVLK